MKKNIVGLLVFISPLSYAMNICHPNIVPIAPNSRYEFLNNGAEVKDIKTDLIWQRCSLGQAWNGTSCTGKSLTYNWASALQMAKNTGDGWRVPNIKELDSLSEDACFSYAMNEIVFPNTGLDRFYWSSTPSSSNSYRAWIVDFGHGNVKQEFKASYNSINVRLVRSAQ